MTADIFAKRDKKLAPGWKETIRRKSKTVQSFRAQIFIYHPKKT